MHHLPRAVITSYWRCNIQLKASRQQLLVLCVLTIIATLCIKSKSSISLQVMAAADLPMFAPIFELSPDQQITVLIAMTLSLNWFFACNHQYLIVHNEPAQGSHKQAFCANRCWKHFPKPSCVCLARYPVRHATTHVLSCQWFLDTSPYAVANSVQALFSQPYFITRSLQEKRNAFHLSV